MRSRRPLLATAVCLLLPALHGCQSAPIAALRPEDPQQKERELHRQLSELVDRFAYRLDAALQPIETGAPDRERRRRALAWKVLLTGHARRLLLQDNQAEALVDLWVLMIQLDEFSRDPKVEPKLQACAQAVRSFTVPMRQQVEGIARRVFPTARFQEIRTALIKFAQGHPLRDQGGPRTTQLRVEQPGDALSWITELGTLPGKVFLDDTAQAINQISRTVDRLTQVAQNLPERTSWQAQLLAYDLEDRTTTRDAVQSLDTAATGIAGISSVARTLPAALRKNLVEGAEALSPALREANATAKTVGATVAAITTVIQSARSTGGRLVLAGEAWQGVVKETRGLIADVTTHDPNQPPPPEEPPGRPFDIREYTATAAAITSAADSLKGAIVELRGLVGSTPQVRTATDRAADRAGGLIWQAVAGLALLLAVGFGCAFAYRWASARYLEPPTADAANGAGDEAT